MTLTEEPGEKLPQCHFVHHKRASKSDRRGYKPASNRMSYDTATFSII
jgi:hypothetical protein